MPVLLARPYPIARLAEARAALAAAVGGDVAPLQRLYQAAADALGALDPDELAELRDDHRRAFRSDEALARAAVQLADTWEGVVAVGSMLKRPGDFRGFAWLAAQVRYDLGPARRDATQIRFYARGGELPDTEPADAALYAAVPALTGLGPELPEELDGPLPLPGEPMWRLLGLPEGDDWSGVDPLDGYAIDAGACRAHYAAVPPAWRDLLSRCMEDGLLVRPASPLDVLSGG